MGMRVMLWQPGPVMAAVFMVGFYGRLAELLALDDRDIDGSIDAYR
jgi:hypothetical protein